VICYTDSTICSLHCSFGPLWYLNHIPHNLLFHSYKHHCGSIVPFFIWISPLYTKCQVQPSSWQPRNASLVGPSLSDYICSEETEILQDFCVAFARIMNNVSETVQVVCFFAVVRKRHLLRQSCVECKEWLCLKWEHVSDLVF